MKRVPLLLAACAAAVFLTACGGGPSDAELVAECREGGTDELASRYRELLGSAVRSPEELAEETMQRMCEQAVEADVHELDPSSEDFEEKLQAAFEDNPEVFYAACESSAAASLETLPPELQTQEVAAAAEKSARAYCDIVIEEGYLDFSAEKSVEQIRQDIERIYREHPELSTPLCVLGAMAGYESQPLVLQGVEVRPESAEAYFERFCTEAARAGAVAPLTLEVTPAQERQLDEISGRVLEEMIAAGELP